MTKDLHYLLPHQKRVVEEKRELDGRIKRLTAFLQNVQDCPAAEQERLRAQLHHMEMYSGVLNERVQHFGRG